jgi:hypothetical protein
MYYEPYSETEGNHINNEVKVEGVRLEYKGVTEKVDRIQGRSGVSGVTGLVRWRGKWSKEGISEFEELA